MDVKLKDALKKYANISQEAQDLLEENALLRRKLGLPEDEKIEIKDVRLQSQVAVAQLRAINAQLQREIMELEDDRRHMKMEMRFRAKWQGEHALHISAARWLQALGGRYGLDGSIQLASKLTWILFVYSLFFWGRF